jgi:hypothetical protein
LQVLRSTIPVGLTRLAPASETIGEKRAAAPRPHRTAAVLISRWDELITGRSLVGQATSRCLACSRTSGLRALYPGRDGLSGRTSDDSQSCRAPAVDRGLPTVDHAVVRHPDHSPLTIASATAKSYRCEPELAVLGAWRTGPHEAPAGFGRPAGARGTAPARPRLSMPLDRGGEGPGRCEVVALDRYQRQWAGPLLGR